MPFGKGVSVVWIDPAQAKLFLISADRMSRESFRADGARELVGRVAAYLARIPQPRPRLLILGPDMIKNDLLAFLKTHHPETAIRVVACETLGSSSDHDIASRAMQFMHTAG